MRYVHVVVGLVGLGLAAAAPETISGNIKIANPWVHQTSDARVVLHMTIANIDRGADRLIRAATPVATKVAIYNQVGKEGRGLMIPGRAEFVIGDDYPRVELIGLTEALRTGSSFHLLLVFEQAGKIGVNVQVEK